jgi:hypothetical protein
VIHVLIQTDDLLKWAGYFGELPKRTPEVLANALNSVGDNVLQISVDYFAEGTGLDAVDVRPLMEVQEATPGNLRWVMDASAVVLKDAPNWERPWQKPGDDTFSQQQLLQIITSGDHQVCEVCAQAAADSPYTVEDINKLAAKFANKLPEYAVYGERTNLIHPYCRCRTVPWIQSRQLNVQFATTPATPPVVLTARQLGQAIAAELGTVLKVMP